MEINEESEAVKVLAEQIAHFLWEREHIADTIEGIILWWLVKRRPQVSRGQVEQAMQYLLAQGLVTSRDLPDGKILYIAATKKRDYD